MIKINDEFSLITYCNDYIDIKNELDNDFNANKFIHSMGDRLVQSQNVDHFRYDTAYLIKLNDDIVGYFYISARNNDEVYVECCALTKFRGQGINYRFMESIEEFLFNEENNIKSIKLDISPSNELGMKSALRMGYISNDDDYLDYGGKQNMEFIKDNPYYISKRRGR